MTHISDIKLIRTDTTLDLSQKAEKGMIYYVSGLAFYIPSRCLSSRSVYDVGLLTFDQPCVALLHLLNANIAVDCPLHSATRFFVLL